MTAVSEFDREIAVTGRPDQPGAYDAELGPGWRIGGGVNGGLLLALAGHALRRELGPESADGIPGHPDPLAISAYYLSPGVPGPTELRTQVVRRGRGVSTGQVSVLQPDGDGEGAHLAERVRVLATYGDLALLDADASTSAVPPELPEPDACVAAAQAPPQFLKHASLLDRLDLRLDPATTAGPWASPPATASSAAGCAWPTVASLTRSCCSWRSTRCRRWPSSSACRAGRPRWS